MNKENNITENDFFNIIDLDAIKNNYLFLSKQNLNVKCSAVVKADAYGLGINEVSLVLAEAGCEDFFVCDIEEGVKLRSLFPNKNNIYILHGPTEQDVTFYHYYYLIPVLNFYEQVILWNSFCNKIGKKLEAVLQFDTGLHRGGLENNEAKRISSNLDEMSFTIKYLMSHLACGELYQHPMNAQQNKKFQEVIKLFDVKAASLANSGGIFQGQDFHYELLRPGAAIFGINPTPYQANPMLAVLQSFARIVQFHTVKKDEYIGYELQFKAKRDSRIAMLGVGYAHGYPFQNQNGWCQFGLWKLPIVGRISMNLLLVDVTEVPISAIHIGSKVELLGPNISLEQLSQGANTISRDMLLRIGKNNRKYQKTNSTLSDKQIFKEHTLALTEERF